MGEQERLRAQRIPGVRTVLIVLSATAMVYDMEALRQKVLLVYPEAAVFFITTNGKPIGPTAPETVDLFIDFTGPRQRQGLFFAKRYRRAARVAVGRNVGFFRKRIYDRVFDEKARAAELPREPLARERLIQREVLRLAGIVLAQTGDTPADRGRTIATELPPYSKL